MLTQDEKNALWKLIEPIKTGMLTTWNGEFLHARPMQHANKDFDGELLFFTSASSGKVNETQKYDDVCVSYSDTDETTFVSLSGVAQLTQDRELIDTHWNKFVEAWFPKGKNDPDVAILRVRPYCAEYWDSPSSKVVQLFKIAKANVTDTPPNMGDHRKFA